MSLGGGVQAVAAVFWRAFCVHVRAWFGLIGWFCHLRADRPGRQRHDRAVDDRIRLGGGQQVVRLAPHSTQSHAWHQCAPPPLPCSRRCSTATPHSQINRGWQCYYVGKCM